jgi:hypothetical protein
MSNRSFERLAVGVFVAVWIVAGLMIVVGAALR